MYSRRTHVCVCACLYTLANLSVHAGVLVCTHAQDRLSQCVFSIPTNVWEFVGNWATEREEESGRETWKERAKEKGTEGGRDRGREVGKIRLKQGTGDIHTFRQR